MSRAIGERLEAMLARGEDNPLLRFGLGNYYFDEKAYQEAIAHLLVCVEQKPDHSAAWKLLGRSYHALGSKDKALEAYQQGLCVAQANGDKQVEKELGVFIKKLDKQ